MQPLGQACKPPWAEGKGRGEEEEEGGKEERGRSRGRGTLLQECHFAPTWPFLGQFEAKSGWD